MVGILNHNSEYYALAFEATLLVFDWSVCYLLFCGKFIAWTRWCEVCLVHWFRFFFFYINILTFHTNCLSFIIPHSIIYIALLYCSYVTICYKVYKAFWIWIWIYSVYVCMCICWRYVGMYTYMYACCWTSSSLA